MSQNIPTGKQQFFDINGKPLAGGQVFNYVVSTNTPKNTYQDSALTVLNANPVILDARGQCSMYGTGNYRQIVKDANSVIIWDQVILDSVGTLASSLADPTTPTAGIGLIPSAARIVNSIATLRTLPKTGGSVTAFAQGYYANGDGGGGYYRYDSTDTTSSDNGGTIIVATDGGRWKLIVLLSVTLKQFGAKGDGVSDDTASIQAAISSGVAKITSQAGLLYLIKDQINILSNNIEIDLSRSGIMMDDPTGLKHTIKIGNGVTQITNTKITNLVLSRKQAATGGYAIFGDLIGVTNISGIRIYGNNTVFNGIGINRGIITNIFNNYIDNCRNFGIYLQGTDAFSSRTLDTTIYDNRIEGGLSGVNVWSYVEGFYLRRNIIFNFTASAVSISAESNAAGLVSFKLQENDFDSTGSDGVFIENISNIQVSDNWFSNLVGNGIRISPGVADCIISDNQIYSQASGVYSDGNMVKITGNLISGGTDCVTITSNAINNTVSNNSMSSAQRAVNAIFATGALDISGNQFSNMSVSYIASGTTAGQSFYNNKGDPVIGAVNFITVGASPFTYTCGARPEFLNVSGGTVSNIAIGASSVAFSSNRDFALAPGQSITITYSSVPFLARNPMG